MKNITLLFIISMLNAGTTGKIVGLVNDKKNGEPLIGANVIVQNTPYGELQILRATIIFCSYFQEFIN